MIQLDRGLLARITLLWLACCVAALLVDPQAWVLSGRGLTESLLWLVLLSLPAFARPISEWLAGVTRGDRRLLAAVVAGVLFGQLAGWQSERTFPLVSWRMFSAGRALQIFTFYDYVGDTDDAQQIALNPPRLFPSINHTVMMGLAKLAEETDAQSAARLSSALAAIGRMHNRLNPTALIRTVSLVRCQVDARAPADRRRVKRERIVTVSVTGAR